MKHVILVLMIAMLTGCNTAGGLVSGAGEDLKKAGDWIRSK